MSGEWKGRITDWSGSSLSVGFRFTWTWSFVLILWVRSAFLLGRTVGGVSIHIQRINRSIREHSAGGSRDGVAPRRQR